MNEEERTLEVIEAVPTDYQEAMQTATFDETPIPVVEEPLSPELAEIIREVNEALSESVSHTPTEDDEQDIIDELLSELDDENDTITQSPIDNTLQVNEETPLESEEEVTPIIQHNEIPLNSASLQIEETTSRFCGAIWYEAITQKRIILAGLGGIGSYVAFLLSRMHPASIKLYDDDRVEAVNMSGQFYSLNDVNNFKASAIYSKMKTYSNFYNGLALAKKFDESSDSGPIMICGFDNMSARKIFFESWAGHVSRCSPDNRKSCLFIDGRLAAEEFQVIAIQGDDESAMSRYRSKWLFSDEEAEETLCSYKQTTFMANMIGSVMVNIFVNFVANECDPIFPRDVPFLTTYNASNMYFKVDM